MLQIWICISHQMKSVAEFNHVNNILGTSEFNLLCYNLIWKNSLYRYISGFCAQVLYNLKNHKVASSIDCHFEPHAVSNSVGIDCYLSLWNILLFSYILVICGRGCALQVRELCDLSPQILMKRVGERKIERERL